MKFRANLLMLIVMWPLVNLAQPKYGNLYPPLDTPLQFSAPFGSIRENHFHSGMDLRTKEREGLPVYAVEQGYISRIKIQSGGYGNALYITHPGGFTSVYGHLSCYDSSLARYIRNVQYNNESFEIDHFPSVGKLFVQKGQQIGLTGNTGTSTGPHLHFEIRDSRTEEILNPLLAGFQVEDSLPPCIKKVVLYNLNENNATPTYEKDIVLNQLIQTDSGYILKDTLPIAASFMGIGVQAVDRLTDANKDYGIYSISLESDHKPYYTYALKRFSFDKTRSVNVHVDYARWKKDGTRIQKLFNDDGNEIKLYPFMRNKGKIVLHDNNIHTASMVVSDYNKKTFKLYIYYRQIPTLIAIPYYPFSRIAYPKTSYHFDSTTCGLNIPAGALYDTLNFDIIPCSSSAFITTGIQIATPYTPLNKSIEVSLPTPIKSSISPDKWYIALQTENKAFYVNSSFNNGKIVAHSTQFGCFGLMVDSTAPEIKMISSFKDLILSDTAVVRFKIRDVQTGIGAYRLEINGQWALASFDAKNDLLEFKCDEKTPKGKLDLVLVVSDRRKNKTIFKTQLTRP